MRASRRRHKRTRKQIARVIGMCVEANRSKDYAALAQLEKRVPLAAFARAVQLGAFDLRTLTPSVRRQVVALQLRSR